MVSSGEMLAEVESVSKLPMKLLESWPTISVAELSDSFDCIFVS